MAMADGNEGQVVAMVKTVTIAQHNWDVLMAAVESDKVTPMGVCIVVAEIIESPLATPDRPSEAWQQAERELVAMGARG